MAVVTEKAYAVVDGAAEARDLNSLLSGERRDFLIRNNGDQVKISSLEDNIVALYFAESRCKPSQHFTKKLVEAYGELSSEGKIFEVVYISADKSEDSFQEHFSKMPWLAIPFSDSAARECLNDLFMVRRTPHLVVVDGSGKVLSKKAVKILYEYGSEGYPFTSEKIRKIKEDEEVAKKNQTLRSVLASPSRDFLISNNGSKVPVSELEGKIVALYFEVSSSQSCREFTSTLVEMYGKLKERGVSFEIVLVSLDEEEPSFELAFASMPWLAFPFKDKSCRRLLRYFELETIPTLVVIGSDGKTLTANAVQLVEELGVESYPFSLEKLEKFSEKLKARMEAQTLESLLVSGELDYVIGKAGIKVQVSDLVGKNILLSFSAHWCPPCRALLPKLIDTYYKIKVKDEAFEVIFISKDRDQSSFDDYFASMPWLALPFGDQREKSLSHTFKLRGIPSLVAIGPTGKTVTTEVRELIAVHGADAYPFTEERVKLLDSKIEEMAKGWPEKVKSLHHKEHELMLTRRRLYKCNKCQEDGGKWSFYCEDCDSDLHPKCVLDGEHEETGQKGHACGSKVST